MTPRAGTAAPNDPEISPSFQNLKKKFHKIIYENSIYLHTKMPKYKTNSPKLDAWLVNKFPVNVMSAPMTATFRNPNLRKMGPSKIAVTEKITALDGANNI